jgi:uncharacterized membrane protein YjjB (DUF3815 family)
MMELFVIPAKACWCGCAAVGFAILFNTPHRILLFVGLGGFVAGLVKFMLIDTTGSGIVFSTAVAAASVGFTSMLFAQRWKMPALVIAIPSVIPLIPGVFAYRTMLGLMKLSATVGADYLSILSETIHNGVLTLFIVMVIAIGAVIPIFLIERRK